MSIRLQIQKERQDLHLAIKQAIERLAVLDKMEQELQTGKKRTAEKPTKLTFGKNVITWDGGALPIRGLGYRFIQVLYEANDMKRTVRTLGLQVWGNPMVRQNTFIVFTHWLSAKLEKAKFPYRLLQVKSKERYEATDGEFKSGKPKRKRIQSEIIGMKLERVKN